jgi:hypothetical protein
MLRHVSVDSVNTFSIANGPLIRVLLTAEK